MNDVACEEFWIFFVCEEHFTFEDLWNLRSLMYLQLSFSFQDSLLGGWGCWAAQIVRVLCCYLWLFLLFCILRWLFFYFLVVLCCVRLSFIVCLCWFDIGAHLEILTGKENDKDDKLGPHTSEKWWLWWFYIYIYIVTVYHCSSRSKQTLN